VETVSRAVQQSANKRLRDEGRSRKVSDMRNSRSKLEIPL